MTANRIRRNDALIGWNDANACLSHTMLKPNIALDMIPAIKPLDLEPIIEFVLVIKKPMKLGICSKGIDGWNPDNRDLFLLAKNVDFFI
ncbi:MAG: hypothetical protein ACEPOV_14390 [Hyphomicrobiales bacterium]